MTKLAPEWVRNSDPVIRSPALYRWTTAPAYSYLYGAKDHKSLVWLHRFKDTEGIMARWLHTLQQFQFSIIHRAGREHGNADGLSRAPSTPCKQCTCPDCPTVDTTVELSDQPFDAEFGGDGGRVAWSGLGLSEL